MNYKDLFNLFATNSNDFDDLGDAQDDDSSQLSKQPLRATSIRESGPGINYCHACMTAMTFKVESDEFHCEECGAISRAIGLQIQDEKSFGVKHSYMRTTDYSYTQRKTMEAQINKFNTGEIFIPAWIIKKVVAKYNEIQKNTTFENGQEKKIVKRGKVKDSIIAAIMYIECIENKIHFSKQDIATFMNISLATMSDGKNMVLEMAEKGLISIKVDVDTIDLTIKKYLETLKIESDKRVCFVKDIVVLSEHLNLSLNSVIKTKIAGAIWLLINCEKLGIKDSAVEIATAGCKKNTFVKFYKLLLEYINPLTFIFKTYGYPSTVDAIRGL